MEQAGERLETNARPADAMGMIHPPARRRVEPCIRRPLKVQARAKEKARVARALAAATVAKASGARARAKCQRLMSGLRSHEGHGTLGVPARGPFLAQNDQDGSSCTSSWALDAGRSRIPVARRRSVCSSTVARLLCTDSVACRRNFFRSSRAPEIVPETFARCQCSSPRAGGKQV